MEKIEEIFEVHYDHQPHHGYEAMMEFLEEHRGFALAKDRRHHN